MLLIDTHIHTWHLNKSNYAWLNGDTSILNQDYNIEDLNPVIKSVGITAGILVQADDTTEDTDWMFEVANNNDWIKGIVAWLPLLNPIATQQQLINKYLNEELFKGVRHLIHNEPDAKWLLQPQVIESLKLVAANNIPFDVVAVIPEHIEAAIKIAELIPTLKMVFDHLAQPPIAAKEKFGRWGELMSEAATHKNVYAKISGLGTTAKNGTAWQTEDLQPYIEFALNHFGTERCFCGGDWPVSLLAGNYERIWNAYKTILMQLLNEAELNNVFYNNAATFYNIELPNLKI